ncbi:DUF1963 domain-containing protein [Ferrimonas kyonanensis]|uniref:DUF1963 domain-containing protein n=1 Tax=Ferrimonas kyonanensis TaxID=364763 RepID=UPI0003FFFD70|nr:DUF1963 domain-containing protein [Ferrimonas kyonanensis]
MADTWFQCFKKVKNDVQFVELAETLSAWLQQGATIDDCDPQGRTALQLIMAKPAPSTLAIQWLLQRGADPFRCRDVRGQLGELYPEPTDSGAELLDKQYRAAPYLMILAAMEARQGVDDEVASSDYYAQKYLKALASRRRIDALKSQFSELKTGFWQASQPRIHPWQSHWGGAAWLPQKTLPAELVANPKLVLALQLNFEELQNRGWARRLPTQGLLQVYLEQPDEQLDEMPSGKSVALYWPRVPADATGWRVIPEYRLQALSLSIGMEIQAQALQWRPYQQLPTGECLDHVLSTLPVNTRPSSEELDRERGSYDSGLMPQLSQYDAQWLPKGHVPLFQVLHTEHGSSLLSLPESALAGNDTDWRALTHTFYCD